MFGLDVLDGGVEDLGAVLIGHQVLLQVVLRRSHKHHPVAGVFIRKVQPRVVGLLDIFRCIQQAKLQQQDKGDITLPAHRLDPGFETAERFGLNVYMM